MGVSKHGNTRHLSYKFALSTSTYNYTKHFTYKLHTHVATSNTRPAPNCRHSFESLSCTIHLDSHIIHVSLEIHSLVRVVTALNPLLEHETQRVHPSRARKCISATINCPWQFRTVIILSKQPRYIACSWISQLVNQTLIQANMYRLYR